MNKAIEKDLRAPKEAILKEMQNCTRESLENFSSAITYDMSNLKNSDMPICQYIYEYMIRNLSLLQKGSSLKNVSPQEAFKENQQHVYRIVRKYGTFISTIFLKCPFSGIKIRKAFIRDSCNEFWVIANHVDSDISEMFYNKAFEIWGDKLFSINLIFVGENEIDPASLPSDILPIINTNEEV